MKKQKSYKALADYKVIKTIDKWSIEPVTIEDKRENEFVLITNILNKFAIGHAPSVTNLYFSPIQSPSEKFITNVGRSRNYPHSVTHANSIPSGEFLRFYLRGIIARLIRDETSPEVNRIFFVGRTETNKPQREIFQELSRKHPNIIEFHDNLVDPESWASQEGHKKYKYLIDLRGHTYSTRSLWLLFSKRVFFSSTYAKHAHWWEDKLEPFVHYIPVEPDLSDLLDKYQWIESRPEEYSKIANAAYQFAMTHLSYKALCKNVVRCFVKTKNYAQIYRKIDDKFSQIKISPTLYLRHNRFIVQDTKGLGGLSQTDSLSKLRDVDVLVVDNIDDLHSTDICTINYYYPNSFIGKSFRL